MIYSLIFQICLNSGQCFTLSQEQMFKNINDCDSMAVVVLNQNIQRVTRGELPPHTADYQCIAWGVKG
jgi:hypothetical protein